MNSVPLATLELNFDAAVYGHPEVKQALIDAQHEKCCFCESKVGEEGDIEHFRPKAAFRQGADLPLEKPGYYWLVYEWDNLLLCCSPCNQRHKKNLFPLADPNTRARSHNDSIAVEEPLFIHPAHVDPTRHISFHKEVAFSVNNSRQGEQTINALKLNRKILKEKRFKCLKNLVLMRQILGMQDEFSNNAEGLEILREAAQILEEAVTDAAEYTAMARVAAQSDFRIPLP